MVYNRNSAVAFILEMFSIAVERLLKLIDLCDWKNPQVDYISAGVVVRNSFTSKRIIEVMKS